MSDERGSNLLKRLKAYWRPFCQVFFFFKRTRFRRRIFWRLNGLTDVGSSESRRLQRREPGIREAKPAPRDLKEGESRFIESGSVFCVFYKSLFEHASLSESVYWRVSIGQCSIKSFWDSSTIIVLLSTTYLNATKSKDEKRKSNS